MFAQAIAATAEGMGQAAAYDPDGHLRGVVVDDVQWSYLGFVAGVLMNSLFKMGTQPPIPSLMNPKQIEMSPSE